MGIADLAAAVSPNVWVAVWCVLLGGIGNATALVCNTLLVQRGAPDHVRGRAFTLIMGSNFAVLGLGMARRGPARRRGRGALGLGDRRRGSACRRGADGLRDAPADAPRTVLEPAPL